MAFALLTMVNIGKGMCLCEGYGVVLTRYKRYVLGIVTSAVKSVSLARTQRVARALNEQGQCLEPNSESLTKVMTPLARAQ